MPAVRIMQTSDGGLNPSLLERFADACEQTGPDSVALLLPSGRAAEEARRRLALEYRGAISDPRVVTFPQLAETLLIANHHPFRRLGPVHRHALVAGLLRALPVDGPGALLAGLVERPGVVAAALGLLDDLKHAAVHPTEFRARVADRLPGHPANATVAALYSAYQRRLLSLGLYDDPGLFWEAVAVARSGRLRPLEDLRVLLLDGFDDFTTTQLQLLEALASGLDELIFSMPLDPARPALSARASATCARLGGLFPAAERVPSETHCGTRSNALSSVLTHLFGAVEAGLEQMDDSLQVLEVAGGLPAEAREVARRIKQLLTREGDPIPAGEIAVALAAPASGYEAALRQALATFGIPAEFHEGPPLAAVPAVRAVLDVLDVLRRDWRRADVVKLLNSGYVSAAAICPQFPGAGVVEATALAAGVIGGLADWRRRLRAHARELARERRERQIAEAALRAPGEPGGAGAFEAAGDVRLRPAGLLQHLQGECSATQATLTGLHALLDGLARATTWPAAARALGGVIHRLGVVEAARSAAFPESEVASDLAGLKALAGCLNELAEAPSLLGLPEAVTLAQFCDRVARLCRETRLDPGPHPGAGVQVLPATVARQLRFRHVFVPGLVDGLLPARGRQDPFYPDDDRDLLQRGGQAAAGGPAAPPLERRLGARNDQTGLFHALLGAATETAWLSYPATSTDGSPVLRSPFVDEVLRHIAPGAARVQRRRLSQVIPRPDEAATLGELAETTFAGGLHPTHEDAWLLLRRLNEPLALHAQAAAQAEHRRRSPREAPGPHQGMLCAPDITAFLAGPLLGPEHLFSPSQLGTYGQCPMRFLFSVLLGLEALLEPSPEQAAADLGALAHRILSLTLDGYQAGRDNHHPLTDDDREPLLAALDDAVRTACADFERTSRMGHAGLWRLGRVRLEEDLRAALELDLALEHEAPRSIYRLEYPYGRGGSFSVGTSAGAVRIAGRVDRIDVLECDEGPRFVVLDYKSGQGASETDMRQGLDFQLPLYSLAARAIAMPGGPAEPALWAYFRIRRRVARSPEFTEGLAELEAVALEHIGDHVRNMRQGRFAVIRRESTCRFCDFSGICRRGPRHTPHTAPGVSA